MISWFEYRIREKLSIQIQDPNSLQRSAYIRERWFDIITAKLGSSHGPTSLKVDEDGTLGYREEYFLHIARTRMALGQSLLAFWRGMPGEPRCYCLALGQWLTYRVA